MKPFDYNKYLKNNPLLKENIEESRSSELKDLAKQIDQLYSALYDAEDRDEADQIQQEIDELEYQYNELANQSKKLKVRKKDALPDAPEWEDLPTGVWIGPPTEAFVGGELQFYVLNGVPKLKNTKYVKIKPGQEVKYNKFKKVFFEIPGVGIAMVSQLANSKNIKKKR